MKSSIVEIKDTIKEKELIKLKDDMTQILEIAKKLKVIAQSLSSVYAEYGELVTEPQIIEMCESYSYIELDYVLLLEDKIKAIKNIQGQIQGQS